MTTPIDVTNAVRVTIYDKEYGSIQRFERATPQTFRTMHGNLLSIFDMQRAVNLRLFEEPQRYVFSIKEVVFDVN